MKKLQSKWWLTLVLGVAVFLFWCYRYPFALSYQEQFQLFLFDSDYLCERMSQPGGLAKYLGEFLTQFYNGVAIGAAILAVLFMLVQRLTWHLMRADSHYALSFIPAVLLWYAMGDESVLLAYVVALVLTMLVTWTVAKRFTAWDNTKNLRKLVLMLVLVPIMYWLVGPMVILLAAFLMPVIVVYALAVMLVSAHYLPYPLSSVMLGLGYYRIPETLPYILMVIPAVIWLVGNFARLFPKAGRWATTAQWLVLAGMSWLAMTLGFDAKKYELIAYDYLVRINDWNSIISKAEKQQPDLPMSVCALNLALGMTNQLGERATDFFQHGSEGLLPRFERNFNTAQMTGEVYFHLGLINTAQRFAFEAMESQPDNSKSTRVMKRLAETNLINGHYEVARKYLHLLQKTVFYRPWAIRTEAILGHEDQINAHPLYGRLRKALLPDDFLFSEREITKICGQLFLHNPQNTMAMQYLVIAPLLDGDAQNFMNYVGVVQKHAGYYNPRCVREGMARIRRTP